MIQLYFLISHIKETETKRKFIKITQVIMSSTGPNDLIQNLEYFLPCNSFSKDPLKTSHMSGTFLGTEITTRTRIFSLKEHKELDPPQDTVKCALMKICTKHHGIQR